MPNYKNSRPTQRHEHKPITQANERLIIIIIIIIIIIVFIVVTQQPNG
jgi:t-SNARE complex subunit (syntaxin)